MSRYVLIAMVVTLCLTSAGVRHFSREESSRDTIVADVEAVSGTVPKRIVILATTQIPAVSGTRTSDRFPNIDLLDHRGRHLKFYDDLLRDRCVCIVFFYTRCTGSCPGTTVTLKQLRRKLKNEFAADEFTFISLTLEPDIDTPEELREYMARYQIEDDESLPDWVYATGDYEELDRLRRSLGVYDLDPIIDADKSEHAAIITFGNDRTNRWAALPTGIKPGYLTDTIIRIAGNTERQRYATAVAGGPVQKPYGQTRTATACEKCQESCCRGEQTSNPGS